MGYKRPWVESTLPCPKMKALTSHGARLQRFPNVSKLVKDQSNAPTRPPPVSWILQPPAQFPRARITDADHGAEKVRGIRNNIIQVSPVGSSREDGISVTFPES